MKRGRKVEYAIYRKGSDELVVMGPPAICAKKLGVSISGLYSIVSRAIRGNHTVYEVWKDGENA